MIYEVVKFIILNLLCRLCYQKLPKSFTRIFAVNDIIAFFFMCYSVSADRLCLTANDNDNDVMNMSSLTVKQSEYRKELAERSMLPSRVTDQPAGLCV